ncbi:hypothetical protein WH52_07175 [Tenacibaculum holothuriorum]|uniref:DUF3887 domain-containing protein n=1 Tax=Tenacibaculum holothuriorum TaxID=1635173 RepID=A0A1Y2PDG1_9FLAO|nr:hypothetical protein [Tenacibaculum holothuriorum]OSY88524.1 hypothetical protein WH52_07175 [Tenacibaculum holothuriorum]
MKNILTIILLLTTLISYSQNFNKTTSPKLLAQKAILSLKQNDKESFKQCLVPIDLFIEQDINTTEKTYADITNKWFKEQLNAFHKKGINLNDYRIYKVLEPNWEYEKLGYKHIRFKVVLKNTDKKNIILTFNEILFYKNEYKIGEHFSIKI